MCGCWWNVWRWWGLQRRFITFHNISPTTQPSPMWTQSDVGVIFTMVTKTKCYMLLLVVIYQKTTLLPFLQRVGRESQGVFMWDALVTTPTPLFSYRGEQHGHFRWRSSSLHTDPHTVKPFKCQAWTATINAYKCGVCAWHCLSDISLILKQFDPL